MDLSQADHFEHICDELFSSIKNESYGIEDDQTLAVQVWFKFQWTRDLLYWSVPSSLSTSGVCEDGFAGDDEPYAVCPSIDDNPEMPGTMDQKDSDEGAEGAGSCAYACKAQASARVDVPTAPMTLKYTVEDADDGSGMCKAEYASDEAMMRCGARCSMKHANCMQLGSSSRMCGRNRRRRCQRRWPCLPSPKSKIWTIMRAMPPRTSRRITYMRDPEVEWLETPVEAPVETPAQTNVALPRASPCVGFGSSGSHGSSSSVLESLLELTDATVMIHNEPTYTLHRIWQSFPRCLGAT